MGSGSSHHSASESILDNVLLPPISDLASYKKLLSERRQLHCDVPSRHWIACGTDRAAFKSKKRFLPPRGNARIRPDTLPSFHIVGACSTLRSGPTTTLARPPTESEARLDSEAVNEILAGVPPAKRRGIPDPPTRETEIAPVRFRPTRCRLRGLGFCGNTNDCSFVEEHTESTRYRYGPTPRAPELLPMQ